jgi:hypothetical protein
VFSKKLSAVVVAPLTLNCIDSKFSNFQHLSEYIMGSSSEPVQVVWLLFKLCSLHGEGKDMGFLSEVNRRGHCHLIFYVQSQ